MIAIIGSNHDDILYFESVVANKHSETILKRYQVTTGTIFNQEVLLVYGINTSILSGAIVSYILNKYYLDLMIVVGRCLSLNKKLPVGEIVVSENVINIDVNQVHDNDVVIGQIPSLPQIFKVQKDVISYIEEGLTKHSFKYARKATFLSSNDISNFALEKIKDNETIYKADSSVVDSTSGGVAVNSELYGVPFVSVKVVERVIGEDWDVEHYLTVLDRYIDMDKAIVSAIGDIGRNDVLFMGGSR